MKMLNMKVKAEMKQCITSSTNVGTDQRCNHTDLYSELFGKITLQLDNGSSEKAEIREQCKISRFLHQTITTLDVSCYQPELEQHVQ